MKELITPESVEKALLFFAVAGPLVGLVIGTMLGSHEDHALPKMLAGLLIGVLGSVVYVMWRVYGSITNALGLDSVANLGLQLILFVVLGGLLGAVGFKISLMLKRLGASK